MSTNDNNLYPEKTLQPATSGSGLVSQEVQRASRQLALAGQVGKQLVLNDERRRWVSLLSSIKPEDAINFLSRKAPLSLKSLERYKKHWNWRAVSDNKSISWSLSLLEHVKDYVYWFNVEELESGISNNDSLPWSLEFLEHFKDHWNWGFFRSPDEQIGLSTIKTIPWSIELLKHFEEQWDWGCLSGNAALPWSLELLEYFENNWVWKRRDIWSEDGTWTSGICGLSENRSLPWSLELLERFEERWDWSALSHNESLPWTMELLVRFKDRWDWSALSAHKSLPWADLWKIFYVTTSQYGNEIPESYWQRWLDDPNIPRNLLEQYKDQWRWSIRSDNEIRDRILGYYYHDPELGESVWLKVLKRLGDKDKWDWALLSQITSLVFESDSLPWPTDLMMDYKDYEDIEELKTNIMLGMSLSESVPWSAELIECIDNHFDEERHNSDWEWEGSYKEKLFWRHHEEVWARLSRNKSLPWSQELTERFRYLRNLCEQEPAVWTIEKLECIDKDYEWDSDYQQYKKRWYSVKEKDHWIWNRLSSFESLPWSIELLKHFEERWDWGSLSCNSSLPWSIELLEYFSERWNWRYLSYNTSFPKVPLTDQDINNIMKNITNVE